MATTARDSVRSAARARLAGLDEPCGTVAVLGIGGSGKTQLLVTAVERFQSLGRPCMRTAGRLLEQEQRLAAFEDLGDDEGIVRRRVIERLRGGWLLVDDAQWLDEASLTVVAALAERAVDAEMGLLVAFRPVPTGQRPGLALLEHHAVATDSLFVLGPLDATETGAIVAGVTGAAADESLTSHLLELTGGSPLLVDRLARAWLADGALGSGRQATKLAAELPERVLSLVRSRLGRISPVERTGLVRLAAGLSTSPAVVASLQAAGLLEARGLAPLPLVSAALGQVLGADAWTDALGPQDELRSLEIAPLRALSAPLAAAGATDRRALALYVALADRLRTKDPGEAIQWYRTALRGDAGAIEQRVALAESMLAIGRVEEAIAEAEAVLHWAPPGVENLAAATSPGSEEAEGPLQRRHGHGHEERALAVIGAVLAGRGLWSDARARYEAAADASGDRQLLVQAATCAAAEGDLSTARGLLSNDGRAERADATGGVLADVAATRALTALLNSLDPASEVADVVRTARLAASLAEGLPLRPADAAGVAELAALLAVKADAPATARRLLREVTTPRPPAPSPSSRVMLLAGWAALREGDLAAARTALETAGSHRANNDTNSASSTVTLLTLGLQAALLRQSGDLTAGGQLARQAPPLLVGTPIDLWTIEAAGELAVLLHRFGQARPAETLTSTAFALLERLGHPPLWAVRFHWARLQVGVAIRQIDRLDEPVAALRHLADAHHELEHYAAAAALWHDVLAGKVDADRLAAVLAALTEMGLSWDASELAGQAAIRVDDGALAKSLLSQAREMRAATGPPGPGAIDSSGAVTAAGLSERECEVGRLVLEGRTHRDIGGQLFISPKTVEHHVAHIRQKLGATSRAEFLAALSEDLTDVDRAG
jgi:DNA-binding NarL/FixJ family response regulator/tetratricopeptide (TPR) repeat protein